MKKLMFALVAAGAAAVMADGIESQNVVGYSTESLSNGINFQVPQFQGMNTLDGGVTLSAIIPSGTNFIPGKDTLTLKQNGNKFIIKGSYYSVFTYMGAADLATSIANMEAALDDMRAEEEEEPGTYEEEEFTDMENFIAAMKAATPGWFLYDSATDGPAYAEGSYNSYSVPAGAGFMMSSASSITLTVPSAL